MLDNLRDSREKRWCRKRQSVAQSENDGSAEGSVGHRAEFDVRLLRGWDCVEGRVDGVDVLSLPRTLQFLSP